MQMHLSQFFILKLGSRKGEDCFAASGVRCFGIIPTILLNREEKEWWILYFCWNASKSALGCSIGFLSRWNQKVSCDSGQIYSRSLIGIYGKIL